MSLKKREKEEGRVREKGTNKIKRIIDQTSICVVQVVVPYGAAARKGQASNQASMVSKQVRKENEKKINVREKRKGKRPCFQRCVIERGSSQTDKQIDSRKDGRTVGFFNRVSISFETNLLARKATL